MWRNWAGDQHCAPARREAPGSTEEVRAAVGRAAEAGRTLRVAGAGHSFSDIALGDGHLLTLERMNRVLDLDRASGRVRVEAGISIHDLNRHLQEHGLALENLGDIDRQSLAGAIATATHGTGGRLRNISSQVSEVELVAGDGRTVACGEDDPHTLRAARVSLGALGPITGLTLRCVPAFNLHAVDTTAPLEETLERLDELVDGNDHFEFFTFPHSPLALTRTNNRTERPVSPPSRHRSWFDDVLLGEHVFRAVCATGRHLPGAIPPLNRLISRAFGTTERVDRSWRVFASPRNVRFTEMEYAVPREALSTAVRRVRAEIAARDFAVNFPLEVRVVAGDDALLSTAHARPTGYVAVHMFRGMPWRPYFAAVEAIMDELDGRPHWGKRHFQTAQTLRPRYPRWDDFQGVRARLDPEGRFSNRYTDRVLGRMAGAGAAGEPARASA